MHIGIRLPDKFDWTYVNWIKNGLSLRGGSLSVVPRGDGRGFPPADGERDHLAGCNKLFPGLKFGYCRWRNLDPSGNRLSWLSSRFRGRRRQLGKEKRRKKIEAIQIPRGLTGAVRMEKHKQDGGKTLRMIKEVFKPGSNYPLLALQFRWKCFQTKWRFLRQYLHGKLSFQEKV